MKKKIIALCMATMLIVSFAGCGNSKTSNNNEQITKNEVAKSVDSNSLKEVTLTVWNEPNTDEELNMYLQCEKETGIKINVTVIPESEYSSKLNQMVSTKDKSSDIYIVWENDIANFADAGGIINLDSFLENSSIDNEDFIEAVSILSDGLGGTYGLPWCAATQVMYYNQEMFDQAGLEYPSNDWSYEEYLKTAEMLTVKNSDGTTQIYGSALPNTQTWWAGIGSGGDEIFNPTTGEMILGDAAIEFVADCTEMVKEGIMPEPSSDTSDLFAAGKAAMSWQGSWMIGSYSDSLGFDWDIATIPTKKIKYNTLHTGFYTINANSDNKEMAFKVIEYLMSEGGQTINSKASGNPSAIRTIAEQEAWKIEAATTIDNWEAVTDSLQAGVFGYTCLPSGVTNNAISQFNDALLGLKTPQEAVDNALQYAKETME